MWARRCGVPAKYPSRIKVIIFSFFSGTLGLSIYMYMAGSNISYLDLERPASSSVLCLAHWPLRSHAISWSHPKEWFSFDMQEWQEWRYEGWNAALRREVCTTIDLSHLTCDRIMIPVNQMKRPLAAAMGGYITQYDVLGGWARFFLIITFVIWLGMTTHDLALIGRHHKNFILDVGGVNDHCPCIRSVWRSLAGKRVLERIIAQENLALKIMGVIMACILAPVLIVWNVILFNFIIVPLLLFAFVRYPVRMSRAWVFVASLACSLYGLALTVQQATYVARPELRPHYALTWLPEQDAFANVTAASELELCTCGCDYPVSFSVCINLLIIGLATTLKSVFLAFRCLKGLRRSQWASLLSVLFPVPITLYEVDWRLPSGEPIKNRSEGVPVQGEVAFDPFALMDEQPDSAFTTVHLRPEAVNRYQQNAAGDWSIVPPRRVVETPAAPQAHYRRAEHIGCCGFPWPTGGTQCVYDPEFLEEARSSSFEEAPAEAEQNAAEEAGTAENLAEGEAADFPVGSARCSGHVVCLASAADECEALAAESIDLDNKDSETRRLEPLRSCAASNAPMAALRQDSPINWDEVG